MSSAFVHAYRLLCGHYTEKAMSYVERQQWEQEGFASYRLEHAEVLPERCYACHQVYQREQSWLKLLEDEERLGLNQIPLVGHPDKVRAARYLRRNEVEWFIRVKRLPWLSEEINQLLFRRYLDYLELFRDAGTWMGWRPEAVEKSRAYMYEQFLHREFNGSPPALERGVWTIRYLRRDAVKVVREVECATLDQWPALSSLPEAGTCLVAAARYYPDEFARLLPWTLDPDPWAYLIESPVLLHLFCCATPALPSFADPAQAPRVRRMFQLVQVPSAWQTLLVECRPYTVEGRSGWSIHPNDRYCVSLRSVRQLHFYQRKDEGLETIPRA